MKICSEFVALVFFRFWSFLIVPSVCLNIGEDGWTEDIHFDSRFRVVRRGYM